MGAEEMRIIQENERITVKWYVEHSFDEPRSFRLWCDDPDNMQWSRKNVIVEWEGKEYRFNDFWVTGPYFYATSDDKRDSYDLMPIKDDAIIRFVLAESPL